MTPRYVVGPLIAAAIASACSSTDFASGGKTHGAPKTAPAPAADEPAPPATTREAPPPAKPAAAAAAAAAPASPMAATSADATAADPSVLPESAVASAFLAQKWIEISQVSGTDVSFKLTIIPATTQVTVSTSLLLSDAQCVRAMQSPADAWSAFFKFATTDLKIHLSPAASITDDCYALDETATDGELAAAGPDFADRSFYYARLNDETGRGTQGVFYTGYEPANAQNSVIVAPPAFQCHGATKAGMKALVDHVLAWCRGPQVKP